MTDCDFLSEPFERIEEAMSEMTQLFSIGSIKGSFMHTLADLTMTTLKSSVDLQLRLPVPRENEKFEFMQGQGDGEPDEKIGLIDFSKPSDFRLKSITANYSGFPNGDDLNHSGKRSTIDMTSQSSAVTTKTGNSPYEGISCLINCLAKLDIYSLDLQNPLH